MGILRLLIDNDKFVWTADFPHLLLEEINTYFGVQPHSISLSLIYLMIDSFQFIRTWAGQSMPRTEELCARKVLL